MRFEKVLLSNISFEDNIQIWGAVADIKPAETLEVQKDQSVDPNITDEILTEVKKKNFKNMIEQFEKKTNSTNNNLRSNINLKKRVPKIQKR